VTEGDEAKADLVLPMVERAQRALGDAEKRLQAARDALTSVPEEPPHDALFESTSRRRSSGRSEAWTRPARCSR
jgi:hypothetical protein